MHASTIAPAYRWVIVIASAIILAIAMGAIVNGMSAFVVPMQVAYGWERGDISLINTVGIIGLAFGGLLMGPMADRLGTRPLVLFGSAAIGVCYLLASFATALWHYYLLMLLAGFFGAAAIFAPIMAAVGRWFPVGAGLAFGIATAGQALGQGGVPFASAALIKYSGISGAFATTGTVMLFILVPLSLLLRNPETTPVSLQGGRSDNQTGYPPYRVAVGTMCVATILCCTCMSVPLMHLVPLIQDRGFEPEEASSVIFVMLLVAIAGRLAFGKLADVIGALPAYMTATAWMALLVYGFVMMSSLSGFYLYAVIYGFGYAGVMTGILVSTAWLTHPSRRASANGLIGLFAWFGHANGGFLGGYLFDVTGDHNITYAIAATAGLLNLVVVGSLYVKTRQPRAMPA